MDIISTALTAAWLDAFRRVQAEALAAERSQLSQAGAAGPPETLTDAIEGALRSGGAGPQTVRPVPETSTGLVDRLA